MAEDIVSRAQRVVQSLRDIATASNLAGQELQEFNAFLDKFGGGAGKGMYQNFSQMIAQIERFTASLHALGASKETIAGLREELLALSSARITKSDVRRTVGRQNVSPETLIQERLDQLIKTMGLTGETAINDPAYFSKRMADITEGFARLTAKLTGTGGLTGVAKEQFTRTQDTIQKSLATVESDLQKSIGRRRSVSGQLGALISGRTQVSGPVEAQAIEQQLRQQLAIIQQQIVSLRERKRLLTEAGTGIANRINAIDNPPGASPGPVDINMESLGIKEKKTPQISLDQLEAAGIKTGQLQKRLQQLGMTTADLVGRPVTELSTGITRLTFESEKAGGAIHRFTTHVDRAGNILGDTQKRFRTFGDAIVRDVVEVLKWTIAIGLVYGPMRKLNELMQEASKIQSSLIDVQITLGKSTQNLSRIFSAALTIANQTSSSVAGVLTGYNEALAATGSIESKTERLAATNILLRDSMILSKLAGIEQSQALDTLVGVIGQAGAKFTEGIRFLDSWVAVSRNANVSLNQLASTFAIVGVAAEDAGIDFHELNAIVATLSQNTKLSADEVGNAIRGFISGFQSAKSEETLSRFGIAVRNVQGQVRSFTDIMRELAVLQQQGAISERDVAEIANAVGGGFRRGAQFATLLESYPQALELIDVSQNAAGQSADALELKMSTLESAILRLQNAFSGLAQALGGEGGALGLLTQVVDVITFLINQVTQLVNVLGPAAPLLATLGLGGAVLGTQTAQRYLSAAIPMSWATRFGPSAASAAAFATGATQTLEGSGRYASMGPIGVTGGPGGVIARASYHEFFTRLTTILNANYAKIFTAIGSVFPMLAGPLAGIAKAGVAGALGPTVIAGTKLLQGDATAAGVAIGGGLLGAMTGSPIWATIGSVIAVAFYDKFLTFDQDLASDWAQRFAEAEARASQQRAKETGAPDERTPEEVQQELDDLFTNSLNLLETFALNWYTTLFNLPGGAGLSQRNIVEPQAWEKLFGPGATAENVGELTPTDVADLIRIGGTKAGRQFIGLDEESLQILADAYNNRVADAIKQGELEIEETDIDIRRGANIDAVREIAARTASDLVQKALDDIAKGTSGAIQSYINAQQLAGALATTVGTFITAADITREQGVEFPQVTPEGVAGVFAGVTEDERQTLAKYSTEVVETANAIERLMDLPLGERADTWAQDIEALTLQLSEATQGFAGIYQSIAQASLVRQATEKIGQDIELPEMSDEALQEVEALGRQMWREYLEAWGLKDEEIEAVIAATEDQMIYLGERLSEIATNVPQRFLQSAMEDMGMGASFDIIDLRDKLSQAQLPAFINRYAQIVTAVKQMFPQYQIQPEPIGAILDDGFTTLDVDMKLFNLAMQDLIDIEKEKGITGIYNLPEGATFYVPVSAFELDQATRTMGGGGSYLDPGVFDQFSADQEALRTAIYKMLGISTGKEPSTLMGTSVEALRKIVSEGIIDPLERRKLGASELVSTKPIDEIKRAMEEAGITVEIPEATEQIQLDSVRNTMLSSLQTTAQSSSSTLSSISTGISNIYSFMTSNLKIGPSILPEGPTSKPPRESELKFPDLILPEGLSTSIDDLKTLLPKFPTTALPAGPANTATQEQLDTFSTALSTLISKLPQLIPIDKEGLSTPVDIFRLIPPEIKLPQIGPSVLPEGPTSFAPGTPSMVDLVKPQEPLSTRLSLSLESTTLLTVDGRVLANIVKPYLYEDLLRYESVGSAALKRSIIT